MERKLIAVAVSTALGLPLAANAVEFAASGHINRAVVVVNQTDNANDGKIMHVDNDSSQSRFRFKGSGELDNGLAAAVHLEYGLATNLRYADLSVASEGGTVSIGHGETATDGMAHARLGGASWLGGVTNWCSYTTSGNILKTGVSGVRGGAGCLTHDGGRSARLRYDTPAIGPMSIAVSVGNDDYWDVRAKIAGSFGDSGYDLRVGYIGETDVAATKSTVAHGVTDAGTDHTVTDGKPAKTAGDTIGGSAAVKFPQGTSIAASWGQSDAANTESQHVEIDHSYGDGSIGVAYRQGDDNGVDGSTFAVGVGHGLGGGATAFVGYRLIEGDDIQDIDIVFAGMRVVFN